LKVSTAEVGRPFGLDGLKLGLNVPREAKAIKFLIEANHGLLVFGGIG
jgi:hypothetical protein